jgi:hypothetical protein
MRYILHIFLSFVFFSATIDANEYRDMTEVVLKKNEQKNIIVKYGKSTRLFKFRWTLYQNEGLVILRSYDNQVAQNILYLNNKNQSFKLYLKAKGADSYEVPYVLVKFKEFDFSKNEAKFELFLSDKKEQILMKYLENT